MDRYLQAMGIDRWTLRPMPSLFDDCVLYNSTKGFILTKLPVGKEQQLLNNIARAFDLALSIIAEKTAIESQLMQLSEQKLLVLGYDLGKGVTADCVSPDLQTLLEQPALKATLWRDWQVIR